jgi:acyl-phosphate glycerol 3-phosphate acyltransferase
VNPDPLAYLFVLAAYLIGAIPFGFLLAKGLKGVDVRTAGSGNIGATNVARVLGVWWFWPVFLLDLSKGLLPTWGFPILAARLTGRPAPPDLAVLVAVATIIGHNFPVYLKFLGGKGVATSLGAVFALDPLAGFAAACAFVVFLTVTRFVSLSSIGGGVVFFLAHFARVHAPWSRGERAMSVMTVGLLVLLIARHRKNLARIWAGTEPRVSFRKRKKKDHENE